MALEQRIESLRRRHAFIEALLHGEQTRPAPDDVRLHQLKREKLHLKDEMSRLVSGHEQREGQAA